MRALVSPFLSGILLLLFLNEGWALCPFQDLEQRTEATATTFVIGPMFQHRTSKSPSTTRATTPSSPPSTTTRATTPYTPPSTTPTPPTPALCGEDGQPRCSVSVDDLAFGQSVVGPINRNNDTFPSWANLALASQGQLFMERYVGAIGLNEIFCLGFLLSIPSVSDILLYTNKLPGADPYKRQWATTTHILLWGRNIFNFPNVPKSETIVKESIKRVREIHLKNANNVRYTMETFGDLGNKQRWGQFETQDVFWDALQQDMEQGLKGHNFSWSGKYEEGLEGYKPFNQFQFAMTQWTFMGMIVQDSKKAMIYDAKEEELIAFNHFWAVLGYALGIEDEFNIALQKGLKEQKEYYEGIFTKYMIPALYHITECKVCKVYLEMEAKWFNEVQLTPAPFKIPGPLTVQGLSMTAVSQILNISVPHMYAVSPPEARAFYDAFHTITIPASRLPTFHPAFTGYANAFQLNQGFAYFGSNYSTEWNIAKKCYYDFFGDHPQYVH